MEETKRVVYREPGEGAIEFAEQFTRGIMMTDAMPVIQRLMKGKLHDTEDVRVKNCDWCGYLFRDKSRPNRAKTCCRPCKYAKDNFAKKNKKADKELVSPRKKRSSKMSDYYAGHLEYPFFANETYMLKYHRHEKSFAPDKLALIQGAQQTSNGGRRKSRNTPTDGSDRVVLRGIRHGHSFGPVEESRMDPAAVEKYFADKYSDRKLKMERLRASQFKCSK
ncbi:hypothetical protein [Rossellomorea aquimaris]|uniref:hypothetical protein n=1 Tax=Rossellomorea aquimaris TaxID=189382 RepID=UPI001253A7ED|nr:hypothetical protein [Rossellomorea aquimaris]TYS88973.1 hypothetical protein FZC88_12980 [Rossellomorea aquimaris]